MTSVLKTKSVVKMRTPEDLLVQSQDFLAEVWSSTAILGPDSDLLLEAIRRYEEIKEMPVSALGDRLATHKQILWLAWYAVWRANDYTVSGWSTRLEAMDLSPPVLSATINRMTANAVSCNGKSWPVYHSPIFDELGAPLTTSAKTRSHADSYRLHPFFFEGLMLGESDRVSWIEGADKHVKWCYTAQTKLSRAAEYRNCWVNSGEELRAKVFDGSIFEQTVIARIDSNDASFEKTKFLDGATLYVPLSLKPQVFRTLGVVGDLTIRSGGAAISSLWLNRIDDVANIKLDTSHGPMVSLILRKSRFDFWITGATGGDESKSDALEIKVTDFKGDVNIDDCSIGSIDIANSQISFEAQDSRLTKISATSSDFTGSGLTLDDVSIEKLHLLECTFNSQLSGSRCEFGEFTASGCVFELEVDLFDTKFRDLLAFTKAKGVPTKFNDRLSVGASIGGIATLPLCDFSDTQFFDRVNFENRIFSRETSFRDTVFSIPPNVHGAKLNQNTSFARSKFDWKSRINNERHSDLKTVLLEGFSGSFRSLRQAMEGNNAHSDAMMFHVLQMKTRNNLRFGFSSISERIIGSIYDWASGYGTSFFRPLLGLIGLLIISIISYFTACVGKAGLPDSAEAAVHTTLRPFLTFSPAYGGAPDTILEAECLDGSLEVIQYLVERYELGFAVLSAVQSLLSVTFIFLFLLALRRKFQLG